jgi:leucine-rich repeat-containing protein 49
LNRKYLFLHNNCRLGLYQSEDDERYRYLLKKGIVRRVEDENKIIFAELPEIPGVLVIYRKPSERMANPDRLNLDKRELTHMPLLEGEERLRLLNLQHNHITQIENLVSLPNLIFLDLYNNQIKEISHL